MDVDEPNGHSDPQRARDRMREDHPRSPPTRSTQVHTVRPSNHRHSFPSSRSIVSGSHRYHDLSPNSRLSSHALPPLHASLGWPRTTDMVGDDGIPSMARPQTLRNAEPNYDMRNFDYIPGASPIGCSEASTSRRQRAVSPSTSPYARPTQPRGRTSGRNGISPPPSSFKHQLPSRSPPNVLHRDIHDGLNPPQPLGPSPVPRSPLPSIRQLGLDSPPELSARGSGSPNGNGIPPSPTSDISNASSSPSRERQSTGSSRPSHGSLPGPSSPTGSRPGPSSPSGSGPHRTSRHRTPLHSPRHSAVLRQPHSPEHQAPSQSEISIIAETPNAPEVDGPRPRGRGAQNQNQERPFQCKYINPLTGKRCNSGRCKKIYDLIRHLIGLHGRQEVSDILAGRLGHYPRRQTPLPAGAGSPGTGRGPPGSVPGATNGNPSFVIAPNLPEAPLLKALAPCIELRVDWTYMHAVGLTQQTETTHFIYKALVDLCTLYTCRTCDNAGHARAPFTRRDVLAKHLKEMHEGMTPAQNDSLGAHPQANEHFQQRYKLIFGDMVPDMSVQEEPPPGTTLPPRTGGEGDAAAAASPAVRTSTSRSPGPRSPTSPIASTSAAHYPARTSTPRGIGMPLRRLPPPISTSPIHSMYDTAPRSPGIRPNSRSPVAASAAFDSRSPMVGGRRISQSSPHPAATALGMAPVFASAGALNLSLPRDQATISSPLLTPSPPGNPPLLLGSPSFATPAPGSSGNAHLSLDALNIGSPGWYSPGPPVIPPPLPQSPVPFPRIPEPLLLSGVQRALGPMLEDATGITHQTVYPVSPTDNGLSLFPTTSYASYSAQPSPDRGSLNSFIMGTHDVPTGTEYTPPFPVNAPLLFLTVPDATIPAPLHDAGLVGPSLPPTPFMGLHADDEELLGPDDMGSRFLTVHAI